MPLRFEIDESRNLAITYAEGVVTDDDLRAHAEKITTVENRPSRELVDFSGRTGTTVSLDAVRAMAAFLREGDANKKGGELALVGDDDEIFGSLRVFEAHRDHGSLTIRVFRRRSEALEWLGVAPDEETSDEG